MSDYVPTKWQVEDAYVKAYGSFATGEHEKSVAEFDRWLEAHDREVAAKAIEAASKDALDWINSLGDSEDPEVDETWHNGAGFAITRVRQFAQHVSLGEAL